MTKSTTDKPMFGGYTNADGTRTHTAPENWVFGTVGPVSPYTFRYAPDSAVYEKAPKSRKAATKFVKQLPAEVVEASGSVEPTFLPESAPKSFDSMANYPTSIGEKK